MYRLTIRSARAGFVQTMTGVMDDLLDHAASVALPHQSERVYEALARRGVATVPGATYLIARAS